MLITRLEITNPTGLHTRPGTQFVQLAKTFACEIQLRKGEKTANAKSLVKGLLKDRHFARETQIELVCDGADEQLGATESLRNL